MASSTLDHHLSTCAHCARWLDDATRLTRLARLTGADAPDLTEAILAAGVLPARRLLRRRTLLRLALVVTGLVQLALSLPLVFGDSIAMAMSMHASHEVAAFNCAVAVAMLATALRPRRAAGVFAVLATFVFVLALLSIRDLASGFVTVDRLATHLAAVAGLVFVGVLARIERDLPPEHRTTVSGSSDERSTRRLRGAA